MCWQGGIMAEDQTSLAEYSDHVSKVGVGTSNCL